MIRLTKLDRRFAGANRFTHRATFTGRGEEQRQWINARNWLWATYGPSAELNLAHGIYFDNKQPVWAWDNDKSSIYLNEPALTMFILKWEVNNAKRI